MPEEPAEPQGGEGGNDPETDPKGGEGGGSKPPWGDPENFDADRAWKKIQGQEADKNKLQERLKAFEEAERERQEADKTEQQKLEDRATAAEQNLAASQSETARLRAAIKYGLEEEDLDLLGEGDEETILKRAERLASRLKEPEEQEPPRRPRERLRPGAVPGVTPEPSDPAELAKGVSRGY